MKYWYLTRFIFDKKGGKYFIDYKDDGYKIKLLYIILPKVSEYVKNFDEIECISFLFTDDELLKNI